MVKLSPSTGAQFDALEPGAYSFVVDSVTAEDANDRFEDSKPQLKFVLKISVPDGEDRLVFDWTGQTYGPKSKLRPWLKVLLPDFDPDTDELDTDLLEGTAGRALLTVKPSGYNRVAEMLPLVKSGRPAPAPGAARKPVFEPESVTF